MGAFVKLVAGIYGVYALLVILALALTGCAGAKGNTGAAGQNAAPAAKAVQFCPGTTMYEQQYNEVGFCIDNQLYAYYSNDGGFLALMPPGRYESKAVNSRCSFDLLPACKVVPIK